MPLKSKRSTAENRPRRSAAAPAPTSSPWRTAVERERLRASKREAVLRTAAQLFNEKGFHATSLDDVAERLHITKPTLYYYIRSKDEILFECVSIGLQMLEDAIQAERAGGGRAIVQLLAAMRSYVQIVIALGRAHAQPEEVRAYRLVDGAPDEVEVRVDG